MGYFIYAIVSFVEGATLYLLLRFVLDRMEEPPIRLPPLGSAGFVIVMLLWPLLAPVIRPGFRSIPILGEIFATLDDIARSGFPRKGPAPPETRAFKPPVAHAPPAAYTPPVVRPVAAVVVVETRDDDACVQKLFRLIHETGELLSSDLTYEGVATGDVRFTVELSAKALDETLEAVRSEFQDPPIVVRKQTGADCELQASSVATET